MCAGVLVLAALLQPAAAFAQDGTGEGSPAPTGALVTTGIAAPGALEQQIVKVLGVADKTNSAASAAPSVPFVGPQVGPIIKEYYSDFIERRTTAFIPDDWASFLATLTPVETPAEVLGDPSPAIAGEFAEGSIARSRNWVHVDLSEQVLVAYSGDTPIRAFVIASGLPGTPTVTGEFRVRTKVRSQTMSGGEGALYYNLPNVQWVQYFYSEYAIHGTYWHYSFGTPRSHGCVNMTNADAKWVWEHLGPVWDGSTVWDKSTDANPGGIVIVTE
jgi:lipoprotein-anchoring transpeptidase ErfK/SrfK